MWQLQRWMGLAFIANSALERRWTGRDENGMGKKTAQMRDLTVCDMDPQHPGVRAPTV